MAAFFIYILKSTFCLILFYPGYKALLGNETFFRFNRKVLVGGVMLCLLLPFIRVQTGNSGIIQQFFMELERMITWEEAIGQEAALFPLGEKENAGSFSISAVLFFKSFYILGGILTLIILLRSFFSLCRMIRKGQWIPVNDYVVILLPGQISPFNWWKYIVLSESDYQLYAEEILTHELAHYHKRHSWDILFMEIVILFHWFNPVAWLLKKELQEVHEFQADNEVLQSGIDATRYQLLLVKKAVGASSYTFANSFNQSKLKKRITMMCKEQSNKRARWKVWLFLPVAAVILYAFAQPDVNRKLDQLLPGEGTTILPDTQSVSSGSQAEDGKYYPVEITILRGGKSKKVVVEADDSMEEIRKKVKKQRIREEKFLDNMITLSVKAQKETPMGVITDIKEIIREVYNEPLVRQQYVSPDFISGE